MNEATGDYYSREERRLLEEVAKHRKIVREERARGIFSRDGNEPTMARYKLNRLEFLLRRLREEKVRFERRREQEDREIDRLGLVGYLKTDMALKSFGYPTAYELLAKIVDPAGYSRLLASGLSVNDVDVDGLAKTGRVAVRPRADKRAPAKTRK